MYKFPWFAALFSAVLIGAAPAAKAEVDFNLSVPGVSMAQVEPGQVAASPQSIAVPDARQESLVKRAIAQPESPPGVVRPSGVLALDNPDPGWESPSRSQPPDRKPTAAAAIHSPFPDQASQPGIAGALVQSSASRQSSQPTSHPANDAVAVTFDLQASAGSSARRVPLTPAETAPLKSAAAPAAIATAPVNTEMIFAGGSDSMVARTVGHAEGTRTADGQKTSAYYGHVDPGNGHWNIGSFSYQHCDQTCTPEDADQRQLARLRNQTEVLQQQAEANDLTLTLEEKLNGIDLANQAPLAALASEGYIDWLKKARAQGYTGSDAVLWARTWSFLNPQTQSWDAPGLGNRYDLINHDQDRRLSAIARALANYHAQRR